MSTIRRSKLTHSPLSYFPMVLDGFCALILPHRVMSTNRLRRTICYGIVAVEVVAKCLP